MATLLSIVIPTKNRYKYLEHLLTILLKNSSTEFEIVVQDNSTDNNDFKDTLKKYRDDKRLKYNYKNEWLSVIENCNLAVEAASGEFICMLGDDDGILIEQSLEVIRYLKFNKLDAAIVNKMSFAWPGTKHAIWGNAYEGKLNFNEFDYSVNEIFTQVELNRLIKNGAAFGLGRLPRIYHGFVSKKVLEKLKTDTGTYFPGPSPDMANAVGLTKFIDRYVFINVPTIISGHCQVSTGGKGGNKKHIGRIEEISHLPKDTSNKWSKDIPFFWSGPTIYAESARRALESTGRKKLKINYRKLYACCLVYEKHYKSEVFKKILNNNFSKNLYSLVLTAFYIMEIMIYRSNVLIRNTIEYFRAKGDTELIFISIEEVVNYMEKNYKKKDFDDFLPK